MSDNNPDIPQDDLFETKQPDDEIKDIKNDDETKSEQKDNDKDENELNTSKENIDDSKDNEHVDDNAKSPLSKKKKKTKPKAQNEKDNIIEELQRDIWVRDDAIKELNIKIVEIETSLKEANIKADISGNAKRDYKIAHMEDDLRHAKNELVLNSQQIEKFMEDGTKTIDEYIFKYETAEEKIGQLKDEVSVKENLLKNKDEVYRRVLDDMQEARKNISILQMEKLKLDDNNAQLDLKIMELKDEKTTLEVRLIELDSTTDKIKKQAMLVDEFNAKFYGMSIDELGNEINRSMFELMLNLRKDHLHKIIQNGKDLKVWLEEEGREDLIARLHNFKDLENFGETEENNSPNEPEKAEEVQKEKKKIIKKEDPPKVKRTGGGFQIQKDEELEKEDIVNNTIKKKEAKLSEKEWKDKVIKAKINNPMLKMLMNISQYKEKGKDGKWKDKVNFSVLIAKGLKKTKDPNSFLGKIFKAFKSKPKPKLKDKAPESKPIDEAMIKENKELHDRMDTYSKLLTMSVEEILQYVTSAKDGIEKIEDSFGGFFSLKDKKLTREILENTDNDTKNQDPVIQLSHKKREINELKNEMNIYKIQLSDLTSDLEKVSKTEKMFKTKLALSNNDFDEMKGDYEMRMSEYKHALYNKDEETTNLKENIKNLEKETRDSSTKVSGHAYELEATRKKFTEAKHHQDMLTKKIREYEDVVRVINKNLKKNTSQNTESSMNSKHKDNQIEKSKIRFRILEDELHKREELNLSCKATIQKLNKDIEYRDDQMIQMTTRRVDQNDTSATDKKYKQYDSQIEVLKEMIVGLKAQIKAKEMDGYRQETKIISLQSQIDALREQEDRMYSMASRAHPTGLDYSPSKLNKKINISAVSNTSREVKATKPLIKSTPKVTKDPKKDKYSVMDEIMKTPSKNDTLARKSANKQSTKPNILVKRKSIMDDESDVDKKYESQYSQSSL
jgi:hypothetical protein